MSGNEDLIVEPSIPQTIDQNVPKSSDPIADESLPSVEPEALLKRLHHIQVLLKRALKRAKTFTIQKSLKKTKKKEETPSDDSVDPLVELIKDLKTVDLVDLVKRAFQLFLESLEDKFMAVIKSSAPQILTADSSATPSPAQTLILNSTGAQKALQECKASFKLLFTKTKQMEELKARAYKKVFPEKKPGQQKPKPDRKKRKARQMDDDDLSSKFVGSLGETDGLSDDDVELAETIETKKNRPGQRARREIWEKKYGTGANHIKNATNEETNPKPVKKHEEDLSSLHPSWAAKKKQKLVIASAHSAAGQGKKITFDQDSGTPAPLKIAVKPQNPNCPSSAHPSWDAKRKEKEALAQKLASAPKAKKIVFE